MQVDGQARATVGLVLPRVADRGSCHPCLQGMGWPCRGLNVLGSRLPLGERRVKRVDD